MADITRSCCRKNDNCVYQFPPSSLLPKGPPYSRGPGDGAEVEGTQEAEGGGASEEAIASQHTPVSLGLVCACACVHRGVKDWVQ